MSIDTSVLGQLAAEVMDEVLAAYGEEEDFTLRTAAVIVEVDSARSGHIIVKCSDDRPWVLEAFMGEAIDMVGRMRAGMLEAAVEDEGEEE